MKVAGVLVEEVRGGYFYDDQAAVRAGASRDGEWISGTPLTPGFDAVRIPATGIGIGLRLEDGSFAWGDAISVQYPGVADRDPPLRAAADIPVLRDELAPALVGLETEVFAAADRELARILERASITHTAIAYGVSQALLQAAARSGGCTMAEVVCREYRLPLRPLPVPVFAQTGDRPHDNVDKMILKRLAALPHGLVNSREKFGADGEVFLDYVGWVVARIGELAPTGYAPTLHFDLYGMAGELLGEDPGTLCAYLARVARAVQPFDLRIETPVIAGSRAAQIELLAELRARLERDAVPVAIVADEWCNTLEDVRAFIAAGACDMVQIKMPDLGSIANSIGAVVECRRAGVLSYLGGSCAETEVSARVSVHLAVATQADVQLAKPGMGVDEGVMIVENEQARLLAELRDRAAAA